MLEAPKLTDELNRLMALKSLNVLDTAPEVSFDQLTKLASMICDVPICLVSLVDTDRQWFKSRVGLEASCTSRDISFCGHAIAQRDIFEITDTHTDLRFADNPLVTNDPNIRFYAGAPLVTRNGHAVGTLCVIDRNPKQLSALQREALRIIASQVLYLLELRINTDEVLSANTKLNVLLGNMSEGMVLQEQPGTVLEFNEAALSILGLTAGQLTGSEPADPTRAPIKEDGTPFLRDDHPSVVALRTGVAQKNVVMGVPQADKTLRWISINATPVFRASSLLPSHVVGSFADITEQHLSRRELEMFFLHGPEPMCILSTEGHLVRMNLRLAEVLGFSAEYLSLSGMLSIVHPDDLQKSERTLQLLYSGLPVDSFDTRMRSKDGVYKTLSWCVHPDLSKRRLYCTARDRTAELETEATLQNVRSKAVYSAKMASLGEMAGGIAHEINNPLSIIGGTADQLKRGILNSTFEKEKIVEKLQIIRDTSERIARIVKGLRIISRHADHDPKEVYSLKSIILESLGICSERLRLDQIRLVASEFEDVEIECRPAQISQIILNLVNNAFDSVKVLPDRWIKIDVKVLGETLEIAVTDSGRGIEPEVQSKLMQPFFTTKAVGSGTGLGLSISKGIAQDHGGSLTYDKACSNTRFVLHLPRAQKNTAKVSA